MCGMTHTHEKVMQHAYMSHAANKNESCHIYEAFARLLCAQRWVMSLLGLSHVTHMIAVHVLQEAHRSDLHDP